MKTTITEKDGRTVVVVKGELDTTTSEQFRHDLEVLKEHEHAKVELDMENVEYISSKAIRVIISLHQQLAACGSSLVITKVSSAVREVFDMTGLSRNYLLQE